MGGRGQAVGDRERAVERQWEVEERRWTGSVRSRERQWEVEERRSKMQWGVEGRQLEVEERQGHRRVVAPLDQLNKRQAGDLQLDVGWEPGVGQCARHLNHDLNGVGGRCATPRVHHARRRQHPQVIRATTIDGCLQLPHGLQGSPAAPRSPARPRG